MHSTLFRLNSVVEWAKSRQDLFRFAKLAVACKIYDLAMRFMCKMMENYVEPDELTDEEHDLIYECYQELLKSDIHTYETVLKEEEKNESSVNDEGLAMFKRKASEDIQDMCFQMSMVLDYPLRYRCISKSNRALYYTLKADCHLQIFKVAANSILRERGRLSALDFFKKAQALIEELENGQAKKTVQDIQISDVNPSDLLCRVKKIKADEQKLTQSENAAKPKDVQKKAFLEKCKGKEVHIDKPVDGTHLYKENPDSSKRKRQKK